jgi:hypothetical protein
MTAVSTAGIAFLGRRYRTAALPFWQLLTALGWRRGGLRGTLRPVDPAIPSIPSIPSSRRGRRRCWREV